MPDGPGSPIEKLYAFRSEHFVSGKEYDEAGLRRTLGLPPVPNPEHLPETPERRRLVRLDDREAKQEAEQAQRDAEAALAKERSDALIATHQSTRISDLEAEIEALKAQLAGAPPEPPKGEETQNPPAPPQSTADGEPTKDWSPKQIVDFMEAKGLPLPDKRGFGMTKVALLEFYLEKKAEAEAAATK